MAEPVYQPVALEVRRSGLGYVASIPAEGIQLRLERVKESGGEVSGTLTVRRVGYDGPILEGVRLHLGAQTTRNGIAKTLGARSNGVDWNAIMDSLCGQTDRLFRQGEPFEEIGSREDTYRPSFLVKPLLLEDDITILYADGGTGKSILAGAIGVSVCSGHVVIPGLPPLVTGAVMYLDWETSARVTDARLKAICGGAGLDPVRVVYRRCTRPLHEMVESVAEKRAEAGVVLTIVDSAGMAMGQGRDNAAPEDAANRLFGALAVIGGTHLVIDHVAKVNPDRKPYGSQYKWNNARAAWYMKTRDESEENPHVILSHEKHNNTEKYAKIGLFLDWNEGAVTIRQEEVREVIRQRSDEPTQPDLIAQAILDADHPLEVREITVALGWGREAEPKVRTILNRDPRFERGTGGWRLHNNVS